MVNEIGSVYDQSKIDDLGLNIHHFAKDYYVLSRTHPFIWEVLAKKIDETRYRIDFILSPQAE